MPQGLVAAGLVGGPPSSTQQQGLTGTGTSNTPDDPTTASVVPSVNGYDLQSTIKYQNGKTYRVISISENKEKGIKILEFSNFEVYYIS
jgi:hypothetical protein